MAIPSELGFENNEGVEEYLPFALALEQGKINPTQVKVHNPSDAAIMVANGTMPEQGGIIELNGGLGAIDLVGARLDGNDVLINPTPKSAVNNQTDKIEREGYSVLTFPEGDKLRIFAYAIESRRDFSRSNLGRSALVNTLGFDSIDLELQDIDGQAGSLHAKLRSRFF